MLWLNFQDITRRGWRPVPINRLRPGSRLPANPPTDAHGAELLGLALDLRKMHLPAPPPSFTDMIDELAFGVTVKGAVPDGPLVQAIAAWRDAGGTIELDNLQLEWGGLGVNATGTVALDQNLQPIGAFSGGHRGIWRDPVRAGRGAAAWTPSRPRWRRSR